MVVILRQTNESRHNVKMRELPEPERLFPGDQSHEAQIKRATRGRSSTLQEVVTSEFESETGLGAAMQLKVIIEGLEDAIVRYEATPGSHVWSKSRAAVGEALWWLSAADEFFQRPGTGKTDHVLEMSKTRSGSLVSGLVFLRNKMGHQIAFALDTQLSVEYDDPVETDENGEPQKNTVTVSLGSAPWTPVDEGGLWFELAENLPPSPGYPERFGRDLMYEDEVAGREVGPVLRVALEAIKLTNPITLSGKS